MSSVIENVQVKSGLFQPFKESKNFTALWLGQSLASLGSAILNVVLPIISLGLHASVLTLGVLMTLMMLPQVLLLPFTGILADRMPRKIVMIVTDMIRLVLLVIMTVFAAMHYLSLLDLYVFAVLFGAMQALFLPSYAAMRAEIFTEPIRNAANSLTMGAQQLTFLVGPSLGGLLVGFYSGALSLGVDAIGFLISVISLFFIRLPPQHKSQQTSLNGTNETGGFIKEFAGGYKELRKHDWLWITIVVFAFLNIANTGIISVLLPWLIKIHLDLSSFDYGMISSASGLGALLVSIAFGQQSVWKRRGILAYLGIGLAGVALGGMAFSGFVPILILLMAVSGAGFMLFGLIWEVSLQELVPVAAYGRVSSLDMFGSYGLMPVGLIVTGWLAQVIGGIRTIEFESIFILLIVTITLFVPAIRKFE